MVYSAEAYTLEPVVCMAGKELLVRMADICTDLQELGHMLEFPVTLDPLACKVFLERMVYSAHMAAAAHMAVAAEGQQGMEEWVSDLQAAA